jgi:4-hydroxy-3-polyprenylbenzoate decarboxylase
MAPPKSLREFLKGIEKAGELVSVSAPVSPVLEITEITDRVSKGPADKNKALLFKNLEGSSWPVLINAFGSQRRMELALGVESFTEIQDKIAELIKPPAAPGGSSGVLGLFDKLSMLPKYADLANVFPKVIKGAAPCQEVVITDPVQPMLDLLPILTCWPDDGGPYITLPVVYTKDQETGARNAGMYRLQKYSNTETGMHWQKHHDGNRLYENARRLGKDRVEVAIALGAPPAVIYSATAPLPPGIDEMMLAGFLQKAPVELVQCKTVDMQVPAESEIIIEGYVLLDEKRREGPFGDHTGVYSLADDYPVLHVTAVTHRKDPIYQTTIVGKPPQEDYYLGKATERIFLPLLKLFISEVVDMNLPAEGIFHSCIIVSIDKRYPGHAKKVMSSIWGFGQLMFSKYVIVVDKEVDVHNLSDVAWRVFNHTDPRRDTLMVDGPLDVLDHACPIMAYGSKLGIDATIKWESEGFNREWPDELVMTPDVQERVTARWNELFPKTSVLSR